MRIRALPLTVAALALASCGGSGSAPEPHANTTGARIVVHRVTDPTATRLMRALVNNPNNEARAAGCHRATAADRRIADASFGDHPRRLYTCDVQLGALRSGTYDFALTGNCFVGHRRGGATVADYGCIQD
jgi:hypothetical protein